MATLYENYITGDDTAAALTATSTRHAQTFTPATAHTITSVKLKIARYANGSPGTVTCEITATDVNGKPTGGALCSGTTDGDTLTERKTYEWREITFGAGYALSASVKYAIVIKQAGTSFPDWTYWRSDGSSPTYAGGSRVDSSDSGSTWGVVTENDFMFEDWGDPASTDYPISLSPGLTVSATVAYKAAWDRGTSPGLTAAVTLAYKAAWDRAVNSGLTISATILMAKGWKITTTAGLTVSATVAKALTWTRTHSPGLTASATIDRDLAYNRATSSGLTASVTVGRVLAFARATVSNLAISATVLRVFGRTIVTTAGLTVSATVGRVVAWSKSLTPGLTASATVVRVLGYTKAITAGLTVAVSIKVFWDWVKFLLKKRVIDFTLPERTMDFTLPKRTVDFTLRDRSE